MKRLKPQLTYANVTATLALFFAMSGGALAASHYLITSTKQIKPSVLAQLKGGAGKLGAQGLTGPIGPQGPAGATGATGAAGAAGGSGAAGQSVTSREVPEGEAGKCEAHGGSEFKSVSGTTYACNGEAGTGGGGGGYVETLPEGKSESGIWSFKGEGGEGSQKVPISFPIPIAPAPANVTYVGEGTGTGGCEGGTAAEPKALPGNLCVYTGGSNAALTLPSEFAFTNPETSAEGAGKRGTIIKFTGTTPESYGYGTWIYTAPGA
jgi:hypothetical protein